MACAIQVGVEGKNDNEVFHGRKKKNINNEYTYMKTSGDVFQSAFVQSDTNNDDNTKPFEEEKVTNTETPNTMDDLPRIRGILAGGLKEEEFREDDNLHARLQQFKQEELQLYNKYNDLITILFEKMASESSFQFGLNKDGAVSLVGSSIGPNIQLSSMCGTSQAQQQDQWGMNSDGVVSRLESSGGPNMEFSEVPDMGTSLMTSNADQNTQHQVSAPGQLSRKALYHILKTLGQGAFGVVSEVRLKEDQDKLDELQNLKYTALADGDNESFTKYTLEINELEGRTYAMKQMKGMSRRDLDLAQKEAAILSKIKNPHVIEYKEAFIDDAEFYMIMQIANNGDFYEHIEKQQSQFSTTFIWLGLAQMAAAVGHLHENKIIHRDLKPQNILVHGEFLDSAERIAIHLMVTDFGLSRAMETDQDYASSIVGTRVYMAPEAHKGKAGFPCDVWSLGCILYEFCMLERLFNAKLFNQVFEGEIKPIKAHEQDWGELLSLYKQMMNREKPKERPSCREIVEQFGFWYYNTQPFIEACKGDDVVVLGKFLEPRKIVHSLEPKESHPSINSEYADRIFDAGTFTINSIKESNQTAVNIIIKNGDAEFIQCLLNHKATYVNQESVLYAVEKNKLESFKELIKKVNFDVNATADRWGSTALIVAAKNDNVDMVKELVKIDGIDVNATNNRGSTALIHAAMRRIPDMVKELIKIDGIDVNLKDNDGATALIHAAKNVNPGMVQELVKIDGIDVNAQDSRGSTALIYAAKKNGNPGEVIRAAKNGIPGMVTQLIKIDGIGVNAQDNDGCTALIHAAMNYQNPDMFQELIKIDGIDVNAKANDGGTALNYAARHGNPGMVQELIKIDGVDVNAQDDTGSTALIWAAWINNLDIVKELIKIDGIDVNATKNDGTTAFIYAASNGHRNPDMVKELAKIDGIDVNAQDNDGCTALIHAAMRRFPDVVRELAKIDGIDANSKTSIDANSKKHDGETALIHAARIDNLRAVQELVKIDGIDVTIRGKDGRTALEVALSKEHQEIVEILSVLN